MGNAEEDDDLTIHMAKAGFAQPQKAAFLLRKSKEAEQQAAKAPDDEGRLHWTKIAQGFKSMVGAAPKSKP